MTQTPPHNGFAIRDIRVARGLTVDELATRIGITAPHMRNLENEHRAASPDLITRISNVLMINPQAISRISDRQRDVPTAQNGYAIRAIRTCRMLAVADLAGQLDGVSPSHLRNLENEYRNAPTILIGRIAEALDVRPQSLVRDPALLREIGRAA